MLYLILKAAISGVLIAAVSEIAKRWPGFGALVASLPLVSVLGMMWLWRDKPDAANMADHAQATFWYVLPSLPMFLLIPALLRHGTPFWLALGVGCVLTVVLYLAMTWLAPKIGVRLLTLSGSRGVIAGVPAVGAQPKAPARRLMDTGSLSGR